MNAVAMIRRCAEHQQADPIYPPSEYGADSARPSSGEESLAPTDHGVDDVRGWGGAE